MRKTQREVLDAGRDAAIEFEEEGHTYFITIAGSEIPVEPPIGRFNSFNRDAIAERSAEREHGQLGLPIADAKYYYLTQYNNAAYFGKRVHSKIDKFLNGIVEIDDQLVQQYEPGISEAARLAFDRDYPLDDLKSRIDNTFERFKHIYETKLRNQYKFIASEYMIWGKFSNGNLRPGTIDALFRSNKDNGYVIVDWTTADNLLDIYDGVSKLDKKFHQIHLTILKQNYNVTVTEAIVGELNTEELHNRPVRNGVIYAE